MDEITRSITRSVKSGKYFEDARSWYSIKYLYPFTERSILLFIAGLVFIMLCMMALNIEGLYPTERKVPFTVDVNADSNYFTHIKPLFTETNTGTPQHVLARYLLQEYVQRRESYNYRNRESQYRVVLNMSSKQVYRQFKSYMDRSTNPDSPVLLLKKGMIYKVTIKKVLLPPNQKIPDKAIIRFTKEQINRKTKKVIDKSEQEVHVLFTMADVEHLTQQRKNDLRFRVTSYVNPTLNKK